MFEKATRKKIRFESVRGLLSVEDLWDIPLQSRSGFDLDTIAKNINSALKQSVEESFVKKQSSTSCVLVLKLDILKHIIKVKLEEIESAKNAEVIRSKKEKLDRIISSKEDSELENQSLDDLKKQRDALTKKEE